MHVSEEQMSKEFEKFIKKEFGNSYLKECQGLFGIPDFVIYDKKSCHTSIISFELKLKNWKRAVTQAFRYRSFSDISYVVLSNTEISSNDFNISYFEQYNIGLAEFDVQSNFRILHKPKVHEPYSKNLKLRIQETVKRSRKKARNTDQLVNSNCL